MDFSWEGGGAWIEFINLTDFLKLRFFKVENSS